MKMNITELLPFLIPLAIVEFALLGFTLWHILTHKIAGMQFIGPILYFVLGKEEN